MRALILLLVIAAALAGASYAGARLAAGRVVGPNPNLGPMSTAFAFEGIPALPNKPRAWILSYPEARDFGRSGAKIYVSVTGDLLATEPADLAEQIESQKPRVDE